jgi:hypothetical protein
MFIRCGLRGTKLIAELREFANFNRHAQRFICHSLDIAFGPDVPADSWARDSEEAERIAAQKLVYEALPDIRRSMPEHGAPVNAQAFLYPLIEVTALDLSWAALATFAHYRFLYERLLGARVRPWLPTAFMTAAALPYAPAVVRRALIATASDALTDQWSLAEPVYWPRLLSDDERMAA